MSRRILFTIALLLLPLAVMAADEPAVEAAKGPAKYVVVLKHPDEVPPGSPSEEPDFEKHGGRVSEKWSNRRVITIPEAALEALRKHPRIKYIQRVYTGEPIESDATAKSAPVFTPAVEAVAPTWYSGEYLYDGAGNVKRIGHNGPTGDPAHPVSTYNGDGKMNSYGYDTAGRLVQATANYGSDNSEQYEYDSFGNLTKRRTNGFETVVGIDPATNRVSDAVYDDAGNVESLGMHVYSYDGVSSMVKKVSGIQEAYIYSVDDERIGVFDAPTNTWRWTLRDFNGQVMREYESFGTNGTWLWVQDYVYRDGKLTAGEREPTMGGRRYYHLDHLGTTRLITDQSGQAFGIHDYFPFGNEVTSFRQEMINRGLDRPDPKRFTGHERDFGNIGRENTNYLDYMHARYYEPNWGRFLSVDPQFAGSDTSQSWNQYSYVQNNAPTFVDPDGTTMVSAFGSDWTGGAIVIRAPAPSREDYEKDRHEANSILRTMAKNTARVAVALFVKVDGPALSKYGTGRLAQLRFGSNPNQPYMIRLDFKAMTQGEDPKLHLNIQQQGKGQRGFNKHVDIDWVRRSYRGATGAVETGLRAVPHMLRVPLINPCALNPSLCYGPTDGT
ncbi:MAG TPA: RHS repeat-associated core domain-containing protein [Thermoanaerobaculia bacterium]|jgi:RHS repeat-associated protein